MVCAGNEAWWNSNYESSRAEQLSTHGFRESVAKLIEPQSLDSMAGGSFQGKGDYR